MFNFCNRIAPSIAALSLISCILACAGGKPPDKAVEQQPVTPKQIPSTRDKSKKTVTPEVPKKQPDDVKPVKSEPRTPRVRQSIYPLKAGAYGHFGPITYAVIKGNFVYNDLLFIPIRVVEIIDKDTMMLEADGKSTTYFIAKGRSTKGIADGERIELPGNWEVTRTQRHRNRTLHVVEPTSEVFVDRPKTKQSNTERPKGRATTTDPSDGDLSNIFDKDKSKAKDAPKAEEKRQIVFDAAKLEAGQVGTFPLASKSKPQYATVVAVLDRSSLLVRGQGQDYVLSKVVAGTQSRGQAVALKGVWEVVGKREVQGKELWEYAQWSPASNKGKK